MAIAALVTWVLTALGGAVMLARWVAGGGPRAGSASGRTARFAQTTAATGAGSMATPAGPAVGVTRLPALLVLGHFLLAVTGLVLWIIYVVADAEALAWVAFAVLVVVAVLGDVMFLRWLGGRRTRIATIEAGFPTAVVYGHGLLAVVTIVLVLLAALGVGGS